MLDLIPPLREMTLIGVVPLKVMKSWLIVLIMLMPLQRRKCLRRRQRLKVLKQQLRRLINPPH